MDKNCGNAESIISCSPTFLLQKVPSRPKDNNNYKTIIIYNLVLKWKYFHKSVPQIDIPQFVLVVSSILGSSASMPSAIFYAHLSLICNNDTINMREDMMFMIGMDCNICIYIKPILADTPIILHKAHLVRMQMVSLKSH